MKSVRFPALFALCVAATPPPVLPVPCTIFMASDGDRVLFGSNEDSRDPFSKIRFVPASKGNYGLVYFLKSNLSPQSGMNDQGLCFDYAATGRLPVRGSAQKPKPKGNLMDQVMRKCATVVEALAMHDRFNLGLMERHQTMVCDATGDAAIIEGDVVLRKKGAYQLTTNFYRSRTPTRSITCPRYKT